MSILDDYKKQMAKKQHKYTGRKLTHAESKKKVQGWEKSASALRPLLKHNPNYGK